MLVKESPAVFFSYARADDKTERGRISDIRLALEAELQILSGEQWDVFQDIEDIAIGQQWRKRLAQGVAGSTFFVPILTPTYLKRPVCREELEQFLKREKELNRDDLVIPLLYLPTAALSDSRLRDSDTLAVTLAERNWDDWTALRNNSLESAKLRQRITGLAKAIMAAHGRNDSLREHITLSSADNEGVVKPHDKLEQTDEEILSELGKRHALFDALIKESKTKGLSIAVCDAVVASDIPKEDHDRFWIALARRTIHMARYGVAHTALQVADRLDCAHNAVEFCLEAGNLDENWRKSLASAMERMTSVKGIIWCHNLLTGNLRFDFHYMYFLAKHGDIIAKKCFGEMSAFLLFPNRGPVSGNDRSLAIAAKHSPNPQPFLQRLMEWIRDGWFDGELSTNPQAESPRDLYFLLNEFSDNPVFAPLIDSANERIYYLIKQRAEFKIGAWHIFAMLDARYKEAQSLEYNLLHRVYEVPEEFSSVWCHMKHGIQLLAKIVPNSENENLTREIYLEKNELEKVLTQLKK